MSRPRAIHRYAPRLRLAALVSACSLLFVLSADEEPVRMAGVKASDPPRGLSAMCREQPSECRELTALLKSRADAPIDEESAKLAALKRVTRDVHRNVRQVSDTRAHGEGEVWRAVGSAPGAIGDCEDIALEKFKRLLRAGFPRDDLFLAVGYHSNLGLHAVLIARTEKGDLVLDNTTPWLLDWTRTRYSWVVRQQPLTLTRWAQIAPARGKAAGTQDARRALAGGAATTG